MSRLKCYHTKRLEIMLLAFVIATQLTNLNSFGQETLNDSKPFEEVRLLVKKYCHECHSNEVAEAEINFQNWKNEEFARDQIPELQRFYEIVRGSQMPPIDSPQPTDQERKKLADWSKQLLLDEARKYAGDPGPVVLRRLSNAEYNYTIQDLTGVESLDPTKEFPIDGAAGEGFTNTGNALGMSPALFQKYLDAAKQISEHVVLLPSGISFTEQTTARDRADDYIQRIQDFYRRHTIDSGKTAVNLQGIKLTTNTSGRLPIHSYIKATLDYRELPNRKEISIADFARSRNLSPKYLRVLWEHLSNGQSDQVSNLSLKILQIRDVWKSASPDESEKVSNLIIAWQNQLWKFNVVGQIGRSNGPKSWQEPVNPIIKRKEFRLPTPKNGTADVTLSLKSEAVFSENESWTNWIRPRLTGGGKPDLLLRDLKDLVANGESLRNKMLADTTRCLQAADEIQKWMKSNTANPNRINAELDFETKIRSTAKRLDLDLPIFKIWLDYLDIAISKPVEVTGHFTKTERNSNGHTFINGWGTGATPSVIANSSDNEVRIPGISKPNSVVVHPSPDLFAACGWQSPVTSEVTVSADIADHHPECGNGVEWILKHQSGRRVTLLWRGEIATAKDAVMKEKKVRVKKGDLISFIVGPRQRNHSCDLTQVNLRINSPKTNWDLAADVSANILESNPHSDRHGNKDVWHFYQGNWSDALNGLISNSPIPKGSDLDQWLTSNSGDQRSSLATKIGQLVSTKASDETTPANRELIEQIRNLVDPFTNAAKLPAIRPDNRFLRGPNGKNDLNENLFSQAGELIKFDIPAQLLAGRELVVSAEIASESATAAQTLHVDFQPIQAAVAGEVCVSNETARDKLTESFNDFRRLFPAAICYPKIVPIDEVVTLTLFHREDQFLKDLILSNNEIIELDRLWDEFLFVTQAPFKKQIALEQIHQFATQDRSDLVPQFKALFPVYEKQAKAFQDLQRSYEPVQLASAISFADKAWRRPLIEKEKLALQTFYKKLRDQELSHERSIKLLVARILVAPDYIYRREVPHAGEEFSPVTDLELASRLSYFLWSSAPDDRLIKMATNRTKNREEQLSNRSVLTGEAKRMLSDSKIRRLAVHFACQWFHVRDFDTNDDKNEKVFPEFRGIKKDLYEETVLYFENLFRENGSVLEIVNSDHTFVNDRLAKHYEITIGNSGSATANENSWKKISGADAKSRGGILTMGSFLASQSGASRTSPILRGTWISETLLGERLPKPPADVPVLPDAVPADLTARQLIELHSSAPQCAKCHARIDPYGFALESFDAIGRIRKTKVDTQTTLVDGTKINGVDELQTYILNQRRDDFLRQFCKKLLGYALARETQLSDELLILKMMNELKQNDFRFWAAVETIVNSEQFRNVRDQNYVRKQAH